MDLVYCSGRLKLVLGMVSVASVAAVTNRVGACRPVVTATQVVIAANS